MCIGRKRLSMHRKSSCAECVLRYRGTVLPSLSTALLPIFRLQPFKREDFKEHIRNIGNKHRHRWTTRGQSLGCAHQGLPSFRKEGQGGFADVYSNQAETDPSQAPFLKREAGSSEEIDSLGACKLSRLPIFCARVDMPCQRVCSYSRRRRLSSFGDFAAQVQEKKERRMG
jgi:hypothetical protein